MRSWERPPWHVGKLFNFLKLCILYACCAKRMYMRLSITYTRFCLLKGSVISSGFTTAILLAQSRNTHRHRWRINHTYSWATMYQIDPHFKSCLFVLLANRFTMCACGKLERRNAYHCAWTDVFPRTFQCQNDSGTLDAPRWRHLTLSAHRATAPRPLRRRRWWRSVKIRHFRCNQPTGNKHARDEWYKFTCCAKCFNE